MLQLMIKLMLFQAVEVEVEYALHLYGAKCDTPKINVAGGTTTNCNSTAGTGRQANARGGTGGNGTMIQGLLVGTDLFIYNKN